MITRKIPRIIEVVVEKFDMRRLRVLIFGIAALWLIIIVPLTANAAPFAAYMIDARNGHELYARNANRQLHPASLTKMMTLYVAFQALEHGEITGDTKVRISKKAASEVPMKLGVRAGSRVRLKYLIRAAAVRSANDAATAIAEAISGSERAFAARMNRTAKALGMRNTHFKNAHGLTEVGHYSTARDMTILGQHLFYDFPEYYHLFSRTTMDAGSFKLRHTNTRFLNSYKGADGIKTGYTRAAGYNLTASAERGGVRLIATVFGGPNVTQRNAKISRILDLGFKKARRQVAVSRPDKPSYSATAKATVIVRTKGAPKSTGAPMLRPENFGQTNAPEPVFVDFKDDIMEAVEAAQLLAAADSGESTETITVTEFALNSTQVPELRPAATMTYLREVEEGDRSDMADDTKSAPALALKISIAPESPEPKDAPKSHAILVGRYTTQFEAEKTLLKAALIEESLLENTNHSVLLINRGFSAKFMGLTQSNATRACTRLTRRGYECKINALN